MDSRFTRFIQRLLRQRRFRRDGQRDEVDRSREGRAQEGWRFQLTRCFFHTRINLAEIPSRRTMQEKKEAAFQCPICLEDMINYREKQVCYTSVVVTTMKCHHKFHLNCLTAWLRNKHTCPLCRCAIDVEGGIDISDV